MNSFAQDVLEGLSTFPKSLPSKYFYDDTGSRIFQQIMDMPEYYLTNSEYEILANQSEDIFKATDFDRHFNIVELGAGDGEKTQAFLAHLLEAGIDFTYIPIDISQEAIDILTKKLKSKLPQLDLQPAQGDYFRVIHEVEQSGVPNLFLFIGANIGNYPFPDAVNLLQQLHQQMQAGDCLLVGFDLRKDPRMIARAYHDPHGITRAFNMNLLTRINRELGAEFDLHAFDFYSHYNPVSGEVRSFLFSLKKQSVWIEDLGRSFDFEQNELIATELSKKYNFKEIEQLAEAAGFDVARHFLDCKHYFADSLWTY